jgi:hypothetical protein
MQKYEYNITKNMTYLENASKVIVFGIDPDEKFYVCYVCDNKIIIFEWKNNFSAEIVGTDSLGFLIEKIMLGYEMVEVPKTRSGFTFLKDKIFIKYRNILRVYYGHHIHGIYLDDNLKYFLKASLYDSQDFLKKVMRAINSYTQQMSNPPPF